MGAPATLLRCAVAALCVLHLGAGAAPSTFGPVVGSALLCRSALENRYMQGYLMTAFGPAYKHEGGAFWFKVDVKLWGAQVTDVLISDERSAIVFVAAVIEAAPARLEESIRSLAGVAHRPVDRSATPVRESAPGSKIVYFNTRSKIFCAKYKHLPLEP